MSKTKFCQGISDISDGYSGFILDQWGVLHDGKKIFDGVLEVMEQLKSRGKEVEATAGRQGSRSESNSARWRSIGSNCLNGHDHRFQLTMKFDH